jgi:hypothetical protein
VGGDCCAPGLPGETREAATCSTGYIAMRYTKYRCKKVDGEKDCSEAYDLGCVVYDKTTGMKIPDLLGFYTCLVATPSVSVKVRIDTPRHLI